jgi:FAD:protein FMN transferase
MRFLIFFFTFSIFWGCKKASYKTIEGNAQGTTFRISYKDSYGLDLNTPIDSIFKAIDKSMSLWDSTSLITKINNNESYNEIDNDFLKVFEASRRISLETDGYFDVTVGPLVKAWGFSFKKGLPEPSSSQIDSLKNIIGFEKISVKEGKVVKTQPNIQIDFNAIAQGYTVDLIGDYLSGLGIENWLVEVGGEIKARGLNSEGKDWKVGIEKPQDERALEVVVNLKNKALATSGSYRKFIEKDGKKYSHAINPKTGFPSNHNLLSVSVITESCMEADAYATAFLVMGLEKAIAFAKEKNIIIFAIYDEEDITKTYSSENFKSLLQEL